MLNNVWDIKKIIDKKERKISLLSYKRFCQFYNYVVYSDDNFEDKMNKTLEQVTINKETSIQEIAKNVGIDEKECIFRLRYLKNKRWVDENYYINSVTNTMKECNENDLKLVNKYYDMVYLKKI